MKLVTKATALVAAALLISAAGAFAEDDKSDKRAEKREKINQVAQEALDRVLAEAEHGAKLFSKAAGWAVFDNLKISLIITGGGGSGVAVNKKTGEHIYMKMGTAGLNIGLGGQKYQVIFLFENQEVFTNFVESGWKAEAGANAAAGEKGANIEAEFFNGIAVYQITEKGLMASADISGTKYSKHKKLNQE